MLFHLLEFTSNGFSLVRKIFHTKESLYKVYDDIDKPLIDYLLEPTRIYVKDILKLQENVELKGVSHITGGGFFENIPRTIKDGLCAKIYKNNINVLDVFKVIQKEGNLDETTMFNTFNQGVGLIFIVDKNDSEKVKSLVDDCYLIGQIVKGEEKNSFMLNVAVLVSGRGTNLESNFEGKIKGKFTKS